MGMFSEIAASHEAKSLKKVLLKAKQLAEYDECDKNIAYFCKDNILKLYKDACGEAFEKEDEELILYFNELE